MMSRAQRAMRTALEKGRQITAKALRMQGLNADQTNALFASMEAMPGIMDERARQRGLVDQELRVRNRALVEDHNSFLSRTGRAISQLF